MSKHAAYDYSDRPERDEVVDVRFRAVALVAATLANDHDALIELMPNNPTTLANMALSLSRMTARLLSDMNSQDERMGPYYMDLFMTLAHEAHTNDPSL